MTVGPVTVIESEIGIIVIVCRLACGWEAHKCSPAATIGFPTTLPLEVSCQTVYVNMSWHAFYQRTQVLAAGNLSARGEKVCVHPFPEILRQCWHPCTFMGLGCCQAWFLGQGRAWWKGFWWLLQQKLLLQQRSCMLCVTKHAATQPAGTKRCTFPTWVYGDCDYACECWHLSVFVCVCLVENIIQGRPSGSNLLSGVQTALKVSNKVIEDAELYQSHR